MAGSLNNYNLHIWTHFSTRYKMISKKIPQRTNSERDIDIFFKSHMFSCFDDILDTHLYVQFVDFRVLYMTDAHDPLLPFTSAERLCLGPHGVVVCKQSMHLLTRKATIWTGFLRYISATFCFLSWIVAMVIDIPAHRNTTLRRTLPGDKSFLSASGQDLKSKTAKRSLIIRSRCKKRSGTCTERYWKPCLKPVVEFSPQNYPSFREIASAWICFIQVLRSGFVKCVPRWWVLRVHKAGRI